jgi:hypothetical protein
MSIYLFKTILALILLIPVIIAAFTMFETMGRTEKKYDLNRLKRVHRVNGMAYLLLYLIIAGLCLYVVRSHPDLSARAVFHSVLALTIFFLLLIKITFVEFYRNFYSRIPTIGISLVVLSALTFATSAGFFLLVTPGGDLHQETNGHSHSGADSGQESWDPSDITLRTDAKSIESGEQLYKEKCSGCHATESERTIVGPGHRDILKRENLPSSGRPATAENIARQLKDPYMIMPSFSDLNRKQVEDIIAYMNTL